MKHRIIIFLSIALLYTNAVFGQQPKKDIQDVVNTVSRSGSVKLSASQKTAMAEWLNVNGESIKSARPWKVTGEGPTMKDSTLAYSSNDFRFVKSGEVVYLFVMDVPKQDMRIHALATEDGARIIKGVHLLGSSERTSWEQEERELLLELPKTLPKDGVTVFKITYLDYYKEKPVDNSIKILTP